jgi:ATP synthase protein I
MSDAHGADGPGRDRKAGPVTSNLAARIARARATESAGDDAVGGVRTKDMTGLSRGLRLGSEFIAAILVGAGIGYLLDQWLGTSPWILLVMLLVGFAAGVLNITRSVAAMNKATPPPPGSDLGPGDDEEEDDR